MAAEAETLEQKPDCIQDAAQTEAETLVQKPDCIEDAAQTDTSESLQSSELALESTTLQGQPAILVLPDLQ